MLDPFNAQDPFDATAERIRTMMCEVALSVIDTPEYRSLSPENQITATICGMTTGMLSIVFSCIEPAGRDDITDFIKSYIDQARAQVEAIQLAEGSVQ